MFTYILFSAKFSKKEGSIQRCKLTVFHSVYDITSNEKSFFVYTGIFQQYPFNVSVFSQNKSSKQFSRLGPKDQKSYVIVRKSHNLGAKD